MNLSYDEILKELEEIISYEEIKSAFALEKNLGEIINSSADGEEKEKFKKLLTRLSSFMIPWISSEKFFGLLQNSLLNSLQTDVDIKDRISLRVFPYPEDSQDFVKLNFIKIILRNKELVGGFPISEWLKNYDHFVDYKKSTVMEKNGFFEKNDNAKKLSSADKQVLLKVLDLYDHIKPSFDYRADIANLEQQSGAERVMSKLTQEKPDQITSMLLHEALKNYPELGEQLITSEKITLHSFPEPVRPSIKNWLADYTFTLGQDKRGAMERSRYLFQNINARNLKGEDRQRLSYILRVYDENLPVTINKATRRVIFAAAVPEEPAVSPIAAPLPTANPDRSATLGSGVRFSSPQKLPYERKNSSNVINITRLEEKPKPLPKNLVNLKE